jgi:hypothetical protein
MESNVRRLRFALVYLFGALVFPAVLFAQNTAGTVHDRTQFGTDINVGANEEIGDATCFGCNVRVRGHVNGDVTVMFGSITIEEQGEVSGDVTNFGRGVRLDRGAKVGGDVTVFGGPVRRDADASVGGDVTNFKGSFWFFLVFGLPIVIFVAIVLLIVWLVRRLTRPSMPVTA